MQLQKQNPIERIAALILQGIEAWMEAGKAVAEALESDPDFADKFHAKHPEISVDTVYAFDRIGRRELHPKLVLSDSPGVTRLRKLPYSLQEKFVTEPVPLLVKNERGWETLNVSVFNLTVDQARQVFDSDAVRTEAAQRAWLEDKSSKAMIQFDEPFRISGRKLIIMQPCQLTSKQLVNALAQME